MKKNLIKEDWAEEKNMYSPPYSTKDRGSLKDEQGFNRQRKNWEPQTEQA